MATVRSLIRQNIGRIIPKIAYMVNISPVKKAALNCPIMNRMNNLHKKRRRKIFPSPLLVIVLNIETETEEQKQIQRMLYTECEE